MAGLILTPEWVDEIYQLETSDPVMGGPDGIDNRQAIQLGKRTEYLKLELETRALNNSPNFTGIPTAPTANAGTKNQQIATTQFVANAIAALVGSAPETLDTLAEIATALGNDNAIKKVLLTKIADKANKIEFYSFIDSFIGMPLPFSVVELPPLSIEGYTWMSMKGQRFDKSRYPKLAKVFPDGTIPERRAEVIRGWDNGRGIDTGRELLSSQGDAVRNIYGTAARVVFNPNFAAFSSTGAFYDTGAEGGATNILAMASNAGTATRTIGFDASKIVPVANEVRMRNAAHHFACLAA